VTKDGRRVYQTIRGTSQLEGYHYHLRALIAQAGHAPRLLISLLRGFNYRWNVDRAVDAGLLPPMYRGWYKHWLVEEVQEITSLLWDEPSHPQWISTRDYAGTKEEFYISKQRTAVESDDNDILENIEDDVLWNKMMPKGMRWLAKAEGTVIPTTQLRTKQEKRLFEANYRTFMRRNSTSANVFDAVDYSAFAVWWESKVQELEKSRDWESGIFRKTTALLKKYGKERERVLNIHSTIAATAPNDATLTIRDANVALQGNLRDPGREGSDAFREPFPLSRRQATVPAAGEDTRRVEDSSRLYCHVRSCLKAHASSYLTGKLCERLCR